MKISTLEIRFNPAWSTGEKRMYTRPSNRILLEPCLVSALTLLGMSFVPAAKTLFALLPVAYLLVERRLRGRAWRELGFSLRTFWVDLRANWILFILLGFLVQPAIVFWAKASFPEYMAHVLARLPFDSSAVWTGLLPLLAFSLIGEEMTYRTLIQGRMAPFIGVPAAVAVASLLFGLAHFSPGPAAVVLTDIGLIFSASILYGVMFARRNNLWPVWLAHLLGDITGLLALMSM